MLISVLAYLCVSGRECISLIDSFAIYARFDGNGFQEGENNREVRRDSSMAQEFTSAKAVPAA
jgi:hypothetical protein